MAGGAARSRERSVRDTGFTLVEMLISVALIGILTVSIGNGIVTVLRSNPILTRNLGDSRDQQQLLNYLVQDVRATAPSGVDLTAAAPGCASTTGFNIVELTWQQGSSTWFRVSYRLTPQTTSSNLDRVFCSATTRAGLASATAVRNNIARSLDLVAPTWPRNQAPVSAALTTTSPSGIVITITQAGRVLTFRATLGAEPPSSSATTTTTTAAATTTTTTAAPTTTATTTIAPTTTLATTTTVAGATTTVAAATTTTSTTTTTAPATTTTVAVTASLNPVGAAQGFQVLSEGDASLKSYGFEGAVAAGGTLAFGNYQSIATAGSSSWTMSGESSPSNLVVGGALDFANSGGGQLTASSGFAHVGSTASTQTQIVNGALNVVPTSINDTYSTPRVVVGAGQTDQTAAPLLRANAFPFASAFTTLRATSAKLATANFLTCLGTTPVVIVGLGGNYTMTLIPLAVNIVSLTMAQVNAMQNVGGLFNPDANTTLIINVTDAGSIAFPVRYWSPLQNGLKSSILWNFPNATSLSFSGAFYGTLLAPNAAVTADSMQMYGDIIAKTVTTTNGNATLNRFTKAIPCLG